MKEAVALLLIGLTIGTICGVYAEHKRTFVQQQQLLFCLAQSVRCTMTTQELVNYTKQLVND